MAAPQRKRSTDPSLLHPLMREKVEHVLQQCKSAGLPFKVFEGYRSPQRQKYLFETRRKDPKTGKRYRVTKAKAWRSLHQYGVAADFVLYIDDRWSWSVKGSLGPMWKELTKIGEKNGLVSLSFEKPHLQMARVSLESLTHGKFPKDGDETWIRNIIEAIEAVPAGAPPMRHNYTSCIDCEFVTSEWGEGDKDVLAERPFIFDCSSGPDLDLEDLY